MQTIGTCRFCEQQIMLDVDDDKKMTDAERNEEATLKCTCHEAVQYQKEIAKEKEMERKLESELTDPEEAGIFLLDEEVFKPLRELSLLIIKKKIGKLTLKIDENRTLTVERGKTFKLTKSTKQKNTTEI